MRQQAEHALLDHPAAPGDAEDLVVADEPRAIEPPAQRRDDRRPGRRRGSLAGERQPQRRDRLGRQPHRAHPVIAADLDDEPGDGRVQVNVLVPVDMVEREPRRAERFELRADFGGELAPRGGRKIKAEPGAHHVRVERAVSPDERRNLARRQDWRAIGQHQMQADAQRGKPLGPRHRVRGRRRADHQARHGQDAVAVGFLDRLIDRHIAPEIIGANDEALLISHRDGGHACRRAAPTKIHHRGSEAVRSQRP